MKLFRMINIAKIESHTVPLFREKFGEPHLQGTGILVRKAGIHYLISAFHVFDMEDEKARVENDPDERCIPQDDMESIKSKCGDTYFYIDDQIQGQVFSFEYDSDTDSPVIKEDEEWSICILTDEMISNFLRSNKQFIDIDDVNEPILKADTECIIAGYPHYANINKENAFRSFSCYSQTEIHLDEDILIWAVFDNFAAKNHQCNAIIKLPNYGIKGMSGGGLWTLYEDNFIPIGIIIEQHPGENWVKCYNLFKIFDR